jgi:hypothetical protein
MNPASAHPVPDEILPAERDCLTQNPALLRAALEFNELYARLDWGDEVGVSSVLLSDHLRVLLMAHPGWWRFFPAPALSKKTMTWNFMSAPNRLALLPPPLLERLGLYWSAAVWAEDLARIIERTCLRQIMEQIGPEVYRYAVQRGRFQLGKLRPLLRSEVERRKQKSASARRTKWSVGTFRQPGETMLARCFAHWPEVLRVAWAEHWRQPLPLPEKLAREPAAPLPFSTLWFWLEKILCAEVAPEWQPCFSS